MEYRKGCCIYITKTLSYCHCRISREQKALPVSDVIHRRSHQIFWARLITISITSASNVQITIFFSPCNASSLTCRNIFVFASSCEHPFNPPRSHCCEDNNPLPWVIRTVHRNVSFAAHSLMNLKSSNIFSSTCRLSYQLLGSYFVFPLTCQHVSLPRLVLWKLLRYPFCIFFFLSYKPLG